jgi:hypothetical protein
MEKLLQAQQESRQGKYVAGAYEKPEEIGAAFLQGKTFIFNGGKGTFGTVLCPFYVGVIILIVVITASLTVFTSTMAGVLVVGIVLMVLGIILAIARSRGFLAVGPSGVAFREFFSTTYFSWDDITAIKATQVIGSGHGLYAALLHKVGKASKITISHFRTTEFPKRMRDNFMLATLRVYHMLAHKLGQTGGDVNQLSTDDLGQIKDPDAP